MSNTNTAARTILRRIAAGAVLTAAPLLIGLGAATASTVQGPQRNQDIVRTYLPHTSLSHHQRHAYQY